VFEPARHFDTSASRGVIRDGHPAGPYSKGDYKRSAEAEQ
jgi:hypothetical protein